MSQPSAERDAPPDGWLAQLHAQGEEILNVLGEIRDRLPAPPPSAGPGPVDLLEPQRPTPGAGTPARGRAQRTADE